MLHWLWGDEVPAGHSAGDEHLIRQVSKRFSSRWLCCRGPLLPSLLSTFPSPFFSLLSSLHSPYHSPLYTPSSPTSVLLSTRSPLLSPSYSHLSPLSLPILFLSFLHSLSPLFLSPFLSPLHSLSTLSPSQASSLITQVTPLTNWYDQVLGKSNGLFKPKIQWEMFQSGENKWAWTVCRKPPNIASRNFPEPLVLTCHRNCFSQQGISNYFTDLLV